MIISLIRSWTSKARDTLYNLINWIRCKRGQPPDIIPQYERRKWNYGYMPINETSTNIAEQRQKTRTTYNHHQIIGIYSPVVQESRGNVTSKPGSTNAYYWSNLPQTSYIQKNTTTTTVGKIPTLYSVTRSDAFFLNNKTTSELVSTTTTTAISASKNKTSIITNAQKNNEIISRSQKRRKRRKREETRNHKKILEQKENEADILLSITPAVFKDDDAKYADMRTRAQEALIKKITARKQSDDAFKKGDRKQAKLLLTKSRLYHDEMAKLNKQAADHKFNVNELISHSYHHHYHSALRLHVNLLYQNTDLWSTFFSENQAINKGRSSTMIDLHGLFVNEARERVKKAIKRCQSENKSEMILIVGNGNHSHDKVSKLKPAMIELIKSLDLQCIPNKPNSGCVLVQLGASSLISLD